MFADTSDAVQIANLVVGAITTIVMGYIAYLTIKLKAGQQAAADKGDLAAIKVEHVASAVAQVKRDTAANAEISRINQEAMVSKIDGVHDTINGNLSKQLAAIDKTTEEKVAAAFAKGKEEKRTDEIANPTRRDP